MIQLHLQESCAARKATIQERFEKFLADNPHVYSEFEAAALALLDRGVTHSSADMLVHHLRYNWAIRTQTEDGFKINNDYVSLLARKAMDENAMLKGFFELRKRKAA